MRRSMIPSALRIALISEHASPLALAGGVDAGGQNVYVAHVARCLAAAGHHVDVLTRRDSPDQPPVVTLQRRARVLHLAAGPAAHVPKEALLPHMPQFAAAARALCLRGQPYDLVHANFFMSGWVGLQLREHFGLPLVTTFHALGLVRREHQREADRFPAERIEIERTLVQRSDRLIASCPQDECDLLRLYGAPPDRITSVPCGVDTQQMRPGDRATARRKLGLPEGAFIVLQLGRLVPRKGIDNVVRALSLLPPGREARLVVVGGDTAEPDEQATPEIARLRRLARELGVGERVVFTGRRPREQLRDWYVAADVFVTTPWYEPFGITPLEAMACGTPVIGSAVGGIRYTVQHGITGFHVPPNDPGALAERLVLLREQPALGAAMGRAGVVRVRAQFTWTQVTARLVEVYRRQLRRAPAARTPAVAAARNAGAAVGASQ